MLSMFSQHLTLHGAFKTVAETNKEAIIPMAIYPIIVHIGTLLTLSYMWYVKSGKAVYSVINI